MKNVTSILAVALLFTITIGSAQNFETPKTGAKIEMSETSLVLDSNGETTFDLWINRSKKATRTTFKTPKISGSDAILFEILADAEDQDHYIVTARTENASEGKMSFVVSRSSTSYHQIKGRMFSM